MATTINTERYVAHTTEKVEEGQTPEHQHGHAAETTTQTQGTPHKGTSPEELSEAAGHGIASTAMGGAPKEYNRISPIMA